MSTTLLGSAYVAASSIGWLDLDHAASDRVAAMLRALDEPGTLDVLGLGTVRDAFSDLLAPGTSTIQTRLRYFLFLPWIFQQVGRERIDAGVAKERLREYETALIECLAHLGPNQGVIGFNARSALKRMPSEAYWGGLGTWGLRRFDLSISDYLRHAVSGANRHVERDDDNNVTRSGTSMWAQLPDAPQGFLHDDLSFALRADEADVLLDHIRQRHPDSLIARYAGADIEFDCQFPWDLPLSGATPLLRERLRHARNFSEMTTGPQYVYNLLLAQEARDQFGRDTKELETAQRQLLEAWAHTIADRGDELSAWVDDTETLWGVVGGEAIVPRTKEFVVDLLKRTITNPAGLVDDAHLRNRIVDREHQLKGKRARLSNRSALENWNGAPFGGPFDYRWGTTSSYLTDLTVATGSRS